MCKNTEFSLMIIMFSRMYRDKIIKYRIHSELNIRRFLLPSNVAKVYVKTLGFSSGIIMNRERHSDKDVVWLFWWKANVRPLSIC